MHGNFSHGHPARKERQLSEKVIGVKRVYGVKYDRFGPSVKCPRCHGEGSRVVRTLAWQGDRGARTRLRYHYCPVCSMNFKSIEEE